MPGRSDVDLLAVVTRPLTDAQLAAVDEAVTERARAAPLRVDLRLITRGTAAAPGPAPPLELALALAPGGRVEREARRPQERDLAVELSICRAHGRPLRGPAPSRLIGAVAKGWVLAAGDAQLAAWQALGSDPPHAQLTALTACRIWRFCAEGRHCAKSAAGEWALARAPRLRAVRQALRQRHGDPATPVDERSLFELLALVRARIAVLGSTS